MTHAKHNLSGTLVSFNGGTVTVRHGKLMEGYNFCPLRRESVPTLTAATKVFDSCPPQRRETCISGCGTKGFSCLIAG